jgi:phosphatidylserine decarboxylase
VKALLRRYPQGRGLGWFEHGSTVIVLVPASFEFCDDLVASARIRAGEPLPRKPAGAASGR